MTITQTAAVLYRLVEIPKVEEMQDHGQNRGEGDVFEPFLMLVNLE